MKVSVDNISRQEFCSVSDPSHFDVDPDPDPRKEIEVDPDLDPERGLKWIRIRPNSVDLGGSGSGSETLVLSCIYCLKQCQHMGTYYGCLFRVTRMEATVNLVNLSFQVRAT